MFETTFAASRFGLTFNHGVLEHYDDRQIVNAITEALRISERLLFVVPTDLAADDRNRLALGLSVSGSEVALGRDSKAHFGDERYLPVSRWEELVARADAMVDSVFGYWIPEFRSKLVHPRNPATAYGRGMYAGYIVSRAP
jgi:hypothetical protein